jgi:uncharacterized protein (TIGR02678 family)
VTTLRSELDDERAEAIRRLLASPMLDVDADRDAWTLVSRHGPWLTDWFDTTCGWTLHVDAAVGFARLTKRHPATDPTRPLRGQRGDKRPFDRRRYQLLCLVAAEFVSHPVTTVGLLAAAVSSGSDFATERHRDRVAFVDAIGALRAWGVVSVTGGDVDDFAGDEGANALLHADLSRLHHLLDPTTAPSSFDVGADFDDVLDGLVAEPRYGSDGEIDSTDPHRRTRHHLARRLLDDPALLFEDCTDDERHYLATGAGREWLRLRAADCGFVLEERAEGMVAVDEQGQASDDAFPGPGGTVHQMALLLIDELVGAGDRAGRVARTRSRTELVAAVAQQLREHPNWAKSYRGAESRDSGADALADDAIALLARFGLVRTEGSVVEARPPICRYQADRPTTTSTPATLFPEHP